MSEKHLKNGEEKEKKKEKPLATKKLMTFFRWSKWN